VRRFHFSRISTLEELLAWKGKFGASGRPIAGGTDLIVGLREAAFDLPAIEVGDITAVPELKGIAAGAGGPDGTGCEIRVGPLATHSQVARHSEIGRRAALLAAGASEVGSPQIRNRGTIGGNICNASPCADTVPPLIALGAVLTLRSLRGARKLPLEEAILGPYRTAMEDDEVLTDICFPVPPEGSRSSFIKLGRRNALSISRMSIAVVSRLDGSGILRDVRVAGGSIASTPRRFRAVETVLEGNVPGDDLLAAAGDKMVAEMIRMTGRRWSTPYKEPVVASLLKRAVLQSIPRREK
jgi:xanthine dehydrogenase FAD-binding subunit